MRKIEEMRANMAKLEKEKKGLMEQILIAVEEKI
jgi:hypothetical protein